MGKEWRLLGEVSQLKKKQLQHFVIEKVAIALAHKNGKFSAVSGECNHAHGPLGRGHMEGDYIVCPWHGWHFHRQTGHGHPPFEAACLPRHELKEVRGKLWVNLKAMNKRTQAYHPPHSLSRPVRRAKGGIRVLGISTTPMSRALPRYSTSETLLESALRHVKTKFGMETQLLKIRELKFNSCGGFYSIDERACTWPCTFSQIDEKDELVKLYEAMIFWADVILVASPIRWGSASSFYYKMVERLNCVQNQMTLGGESLIKNKVAGFIITGGQDGVQAVAGQMLMFFSELGFRFPQFPFVGHSRGWNAEDMANNVEFVKNTAALRRDVNSLAERAVQAASLLVGSNKSIINP